VGGASRGADELARWLIEAGHTVTHFCWEFSQTPAPFQRKLGGPRLVRKAVKEFHKIGVRLGFPQLLPFEYFAQLGWLRERFDLFHFHDLCDAISYQTLIELSQRKPVVFTVHDCSAFTGGCLYPMECEKYKTRCGECPQLGHWPMETKIDHTGFLQQLRRRAASQPGIQYVFPSEWMARKMTDVMALGRPGVQISNAIDPIQMAPTSKKEAREKLSLPVDRPVILFSAHYLSDPRKGGTYAVAAIRQVMDLAPVVITLGYPDPTFESQLEGVKIVSFGYVSEIEKMALIYSAADIYLFTSLADNCPYTVLEAMACGKAVVGFATGGVPELVISEETGLLVPPRDGPALAAAIRRAIQHGSLTQQWGDQARRRIEIHFNKQLFMGKMNSLYENFVQDWGSS